MVFLAESLDELLLVLLVYLVEVLLLGGHFATLFALVVFVLPHDIFILLVKHRVFFRLCFLLKLLLSLFKHLIHFSLSFLLLAWLLLCLLGLCSFGVHGLLV